MSKLLALATALIFAATILRLDRTGGHAGRRRHRRRRPRPRCPRCHVQRWRPLRSPRIQLSARESAPPAASARRRLRSAPPRNRSPKSTQQADKEPAEKAPASTATNEASGIATTGGPVVAPVTTGSTDTASAQTENSSISLARSPTTRRRRRRSTRPARRRREEPRLQEVLPLGRHDPLGPLRVSSGAAIEVLTSSSIPASPPGSIALWRRPTLPMSCKIETCYARNSASRAAPTSFAPRCQPWGRP